MWDEASFSRGGGGVRRDEPRSSGWTDDDDLDGCLRTRVSGQFSGGIGANVGVSAVYGSLQLKDRINNCQSRRST